MGLNSENQKFNPFPGLRPFAPDEYHLFFGRETESSEVLRKLIDNRFVTVIGASGSGKSSLIYCGVLPRVKSLATQESGNWKVIAFRPGNEPYVNLAEAIADQVPAHQKPSTTTEGIMLDMHLNADGITTALKKNLQTGSNDKVLLVVDQFEEIFRYSKVASSHSATVQAAGFVEKIVNAVNSSDAGIYIIVTMRSDFIGECAHYQGLTQLINNSNYLVPHMSRNNYKSAIEGPIKYAGAQIDPKLVETLLDDIGDRTDQLPVLQHALMRTWTYWQELDEPGRPVSYSDYDSVGTMSDAMSRHANEAYEELDEKEKEICEKLFKTITEKGTDNKGIRHPSSVATIKSVVECSSDDLYRVVEKFRIPSRSFITPRQNIPLTDESIIDLSHESLMRLWSKLREWVDDEAASVQMYLRLAEASAMYQQGRTTLWRPPDLQLAINWRDSHKPTLAWAKRYDAAFERAMVYLRTSEKTYLSEEENKIRLQKRQIRRTNIVASILGTAAIISVGFMLFAFVQKIAADRQTILAEERRQEAERETKRADSSTVVAIQRKVEADTNALRAMRNEEDAIRQRERAEQEQIRAELNAELARQQEREALIQSDSARRASIRADQNAAVATEEKNNALRLRMLSISKSMSIKSIQVQQKDLQTLLAYQAYLFNVRNDGPDNDADIYNGLYSAAKQFGSPNIKSFIGIKDQIKSIAFIPRKGEFYTSDFGGKILKWSTDGPVQTYQVIYSGTDIIEVLAVSPDQEWLAAGSSNSSIRMIPLKGTNMQYELKGHTRNLKSLVFSFDGKFLYSASLDGKVLKWDIATRTSTNISTGSVSFTSIDVSSNGKMIAGISSDGKAVVWDPDNFNSAFNIPTAGKVIKVVRFKPDENILAVGDISGNLELWDVEQRKLITTVKAHSAQVNDIKFNPVRNQIATGSNDQTLKIFNYKDISDLTETPITLSDHEGFVLSIQFSSDGQLIVTGTYDGQIISRPTHVDYLVRDMCDLVERDMTQEEWNTYVARDIPLEKTCNKDYNIKVNIVR